MMVRKWVITGIYLFCAIVWALNFFVEWHKNGTLEGNTILFGIAAICFAISAVLHLIRVYQEKKKQ